MFVTRSNPIETAKRDLSYPKEVRLLRPSEFRKVYQEGFRISGPYFAAFCLKVEGQVRARVGMTAPKALGNSVVRNRLKRRLREAVRLNLWALRSQWWIVFNPRRGVLDAPFEELEKEVGRVLSKCAAS